MDSLVAENYIYHETLDPNTLDAQSYLVKQKNLVPYLDQQRGQGSYISSRVTIDCQIGNGSDFIDWRDAYITLPYHYKLTCTSGATSTVAGAVANNFFTTPKNCSLVESMLVEQSGRTIIQTTSNLSHLVNFVKHNTTTSESLATQAGDWYYPDSQFPESVTASIAGVRNVANATTANTTSAIANNVVVNDGALQRQRMAMPQNRLTTFVSAAAGTTEQAYYQSATATTTIDTTGTILSDTHYLAVIYLRDLSDFFMKAPLQKGGYKFTFVINQATTTFVATGAVTTPFSTALTVPITNLIGSSTVQPCLLNIGGSNCVNSLLTATSTTYQYTLVSEIDTSSDTRQSGVYMWVPSLTLADKDEARLLSKPIIHRNPYMINSATYTGFTTQNPINIQLFSAIRNPRALIIIPQLGIATQTQTSQCSPFNTSPSTPDPLSLIKTQIRIGSKSVLPSPINYGWNQFIQNTSQIFTTNGGLSNQCSGVINLSKWMNLYRYYAFDLSLTSMDLRDVSQLITFEAFNNSAVTIDLYVFCLYEEDVSFDLQNASVQVGN